MSKSAKEALAPTGVLRAAINMGNMLLVTGEAANGNPEGVAPSLAAHIAEQLGVEVVYVPFDRPGSLVDAADSGEWDIGLVGDVPARAAVIDFTPPYVEIEATYMVPAGSSLRAISEVDSPGVRIAISGRSAYDLYLTDHLEHAELVRGEGIPGSIEMFATGEFEALAALRPALIPALPDFPGARILDGRFTTVEQAMGTPKGRDPVALEFLVGVVESVKSSGMVQQLIDQFGVTGKLQVPSP